jgi:hypothetical protein
MGAYGAGELGWGVHRKVRKTEQTAGDDGILLRALCDRPSGTPNSGGVEWKDYTRSQYAYSEFKCENGSNESDP